MNEIVIAKDLSLLFIVDEHKDAFAKQVLDEHMDSFGQTTQTIQGIPVVDGLFYDRKYLLAGICYDWYGNLDFYHACTSGFDTGFETEEEMYERIDEELEELELNEPRGFHDYRIMLQDDMMRVLDFYHISYLKGNYNPFSGKRGLELYNEPIKTVW